MTREMHLKRRKVVLRPGEQTGWHTHPGPLFVTVVQGALTHYDGEGRARRYTPGDRFVEARGCEAVHMGANQGAVPCVLDVLYLVPAGRPLRVDAPIDGE